VKSCPPYGTAFYESVERGSEASAREILPLILDLVRPRSVVDVGCGDGSWLRVLAEQGVDDLLGLDGPWITRSALKIPEQSFDTIDLRQPFRLPRHFDMAISLEVAEHLPPEAAVDLVEHLTALAPVVLFSAAIPHQGGTEHVNEQWADHWATLFGRSGYAVLDVVRPAFWIHDGVEPWYAQNTFLYASPEALAGNDRLAQKAAEGLSMPWRVVHPVLLERAVSVDHLTLRDHLRALPRAARTALFRRHVWRAAR
jgi:SAM-dependent methyltransferase